MAIHGSTYLLRRGRGESNGWERERMWKREREREVENNSIKVILAANYLFGCSTSLQLYLGR